MRKILTLIVALILILQSAALIPNRTLGDPYEEFNIRNVNVRSSADTPGIYPGSRRVNLKVEVVYLGGSPAQSVVGWLNTTDEHIGFSSGSGACSPARLLNGTVATNVNVGDYVTFEYLLDISSSLSPGLYELRLNITYLKAGIFSFEIHPIPLTVSPYPTISLGVVDAYFSPTSYPGSVDTNLYVILENTGDNVISSANFNITLPRNFVIKNPRASTGLVDKGDRFTLTFSGISIPTNARVGVYNATLYVDAGARTEDDVSYSGSASLNVSVRVESPPPEEPIMLASVNTLYNGASAPLLPSAKDIVLRVYLINRLPDAISAMTVNVGLPNGMDVQDISGTYVNGMTPGGSCFVDLILNIDPGVSAGRYYGRLDVKYLKIVSGSSFLMSQSIYFPVDVESFHSYVSEFALVTVYWGYPDPTPVYSTSRYVPLTIELINEGRYAVHEVVVNASSSPPALLRSIKCSDPCAATLASGGSCTAILYFDINTTALNIPLKVFVNYTFKEFGTHIKLVRQFKASLPVESYPASESVLSVVDSGWQNSVSVFPKTSNATYQITMANRAPFAISGVNLSLKLPNGMSSRGGNEATAYFEGPIRNLATFTASFTVSVGNIPPGSYRANLTADCIILSGGPGIRHVEQFTLQININDDGSALEPVESRWYEGSVGPNTYGVHLIILIRNVYVDGLRGAVLELHLPEGMRNSADNSTHVKATPISLQLQQPLQTQDLANLLSALLSAQQVSPAQVYGRGDILAFMVSLNLFDVKVGNHTIDGRMSYIDAWGSRREIPLKIPVATLGRTEYIEVVMDESLSVRSRCVNTSLTLINRGSSEIYDAYVMVSPYQGTPILIASPVVNYVGKISPGERREIRITLAYNPLGFYPQTGGAASVTYGPVPFMVSIFYRDASGYSRVFNNSITVIVEPFIDLMTRNVRAVGTGSASTVTGIIVNYGSSTAYRVEVELKIDDAVQSSFIGDVDPGAEVAFRLDINKYGSSAVLTVKYYNALNELESKESSVNVILQEEAVTQPVTTERLPIEIWIIVAGVLAFLAAATIMIYKMMKKSKLTIKP
ncbi:hypothetical protein KEJ17_06505 [Candidatus Bathyarchaeota archaeon]|nr:hypothetical protein [Candidatus Bathyarchaeota archaeon]